MLLNGITQWLQQLEFGSLIEMVVIVAASLLCITVHETCHGLVALWLGDQTAKRQGRLSLNPLRHVDPMGLVMMALVRFGWAKPVPIDMSNFKHPKTGMAWTALGGPVSNVILALIALFVRACIYPSYLVSDSAVLAYGMLFLEYIAVLSAGLAVFNLFPVPPLDGSKVLFAVLPDHWYRKLMQYERYGMILLAILLLTNILDVPLMFLRGKLLDILTWITTPVFQFFLDRVI